MNGHELIESAIYDELPYRIVLDLNKPFGLEIEVSLDDPMDRYYICNHYLEQKAYERDIDKTVGGNFPLEIKTPLLSDDVETWKDLSDLAKRMRDCSINFDTSAFQVNIDIDYDFLDCYYLLLLFYSFEHIIFRFSMSGKNSLRPLKYASSLENFLKNYKKREVSRIGLDGLIDNKNYAFSFKYRNRTSYNSAPNGFETRIPNGCSDAWMWQNYVNTFYYLVNVISKLDLDHIDYSLCYGELKQKDYLQLYLDDAVNFSNIIFSNDIDKIYFLRQYIGNDRAKAKHYLRNLR